jgi:hypothetical protein
LLTAELHAAGTSVVGQALTTLLTQVARHESSPDGVTWAPSMDVTLRKIA